MGKSSSTLSTAPIDPTDTIDKVENPIQLRHLNFLEA